MPHRLLHCCFLFIICWSTACHRQTAITAPQTALPPASTPIPPTQTATTVPTATAQASLVENVTLTATAVPHNTRPPSPTPPNTPTPSATPIPTLVNGMPAREFVVLPEEVLVHSREIFARGQELGRDAHVFSKIGDSVVLTTHFLIKFDTGLYELGEYADLQRVIDYFAGSYGRYGVAIRVGLHAYGILDPAWANKEWCQANESMLACEIRLNNPSLLIIRVGSNDSLKAAEFDQAMREVVQQTIDSGVIPIIVTKADRFEGDDNHNNEILRQITADFHIPLWDFDRIADTLPNRGLSADGIHLTITESNDYTQAKTFTRGYPISDLTGLLMLDALWTQVIAYEN